MSALVVTVHDLPAPQGSKRHVGRGVLVESSARVKPCARPSSTPPRGPGRRRKRLRPFLGPVDVKVTFTLPRPAEHFRTGRHAHLLRDGAPAAPHRLPDVDKLLRSTLDALTAAGVWQDDAQVVELTGRKIYPGSGVDALEHPGAVIRVHAQLATVGAFEGDLCQEVAG